MALWRKRMDLAGSIPLAISAAAISRTLPRSSAGSMSTVSAWRSARKKRHCASSCILTQRRIAPSRFPRCKFPVGCIPETTRTADSAGIFVRPPSPEEGSKLLLVGASEYPDEREIDGHPTADQSGGADKPLAHRALEPAQQALPDEDQCNDHGERCDELSGDPRRQPLLDPEMTA